MADDLMDLDPQQAADEFDLDDTANDTDVTDAVGRDLKITDDGGVVKRIVTAGAGWDKPETGDEVTVHYVGTLTDGTEFDSSRGRDAPFTFKLGQGSVIKGWDLGVATMRKGEKSVFTITAPYAYGDAGSPPKIPPGATLVFEVELLSWKSLKDLTGDGGVIKTILGAGEGWQQPDSKDEVVVTYSARVQGEAEPFYKTPEGGVAFITAEGVNGLAALPVAVRSMKKGEVAKLVVSPQYAYGDAGTEGVPPGSTLEVELTLDAIRKVENVTDDGAVTKKTLVDSTDWKRPNEGAKVTVQLTGKLEDGTVFVSHPAGSELVFTTDEEAVPEGLDQAVMKMKAGETALITIPPAYGYGDAGHSGNTGVAVPPGATLTYEVTLVSTENAKESWEMSDAEKVEAALARKEKGNKYYKEGRTARAIRVWDKASTLIAHDKSLSEELKLAARDVRRSLQLNLAAAYIKLRSWKEAVAQATKVLDAEPSNTKALYRRAQALLGLGDYVEAEVDIKRGLVEAPNNADLVALHRRLKAESKAAAAKEAALYSKMFKFPAAAKPRPAAVAATPAPAAPDDVPASETATPEADQAAAPTEPAAAPVVDVA